MVTLITIQTIALLIILAVLLLNAKTVIRLGSIEPLTGAPPRVALVVPARNEESRIRPSLDAVTSQSYPNLRVYVFDDDSSDGTLSILREYERMRPDLYTILDSEPLPPDWLGKPFGCQTLANRAIAEGAEVVIFMDADTLPAPDAVAQSLSLLLERQLDFFSCFPEQRCETWSERLIVPVLCDLFLFGFLPFPLITKSRDPRFSAANGQWMVFQSKAYLKLGGHARVKHDVLEDMRLARIAKAEGLATMTIYGQGALACRMYRSRREVVDGFSKNLFAFAAFRTGRYLSFLACVVMLFLAPFALLPLSPEFLVPCVLVLLISTIQSLAFTGDSWIMILLRPAGVAAAVAVGLISWWRHTRGIAEWRGRPVSGKSILGTCERL